MGDVVPGRLLVGPDTWVLPELLIRFVRAVHELNRCEPKHGSGLSAQQIRALLYLVSHPGMTIKELAQALTVSEARASRLVDELAAEGHVSAERDLADRRQVRLHVAPSAAQNARRIHGERKAALESALAGSSETEVKAFLGIMQRIVEEYEALVERVMAEGADAPAGPATVAQTAVGTSDA